MNSLLDPQSSLAPLVQIDFREIQPEIECLCLAREWVGVDRDACRQDVARLGLDGAAEYNASIAGDCTAWELLASDMGKKALRVALSEF